MKSRYIDRWGVSMMAIACMGMTSCATDSQYESERTQNSFFNQLGGSISTMQWWKTAVTLQVNLTTEAPTKLWLMSGDDQGTLYDYAEASASGVVQMVAPQGKGSSFYLVTVCNRQKNVFPVTLSGKAVENLSVSITLDDKSNGVEIFAKAENPENAPLSLTRATETNASLYGNSYLGNAIYMELSDDQRREAFQLLDRAYKEGTPAKELGANCDYELKSNGDFQITWFAGNTFSAKPHTLGFYYHTPGTYDDIEYVDIAETELYDYIDGLAKVQYKVNEEAAQKFGVIANHWYDANFDVDDTFDDPHPNLPGRVGDDAYNSIAVYQRYGQNINGLRGITFTLKVPEGKYVGFYDRVESVPLPSQYDRLEKMGVKPYTTRNQFKAMNFSCEAMNMKLKGSYRSCIIKSDHAYWLGMEDNYDGGDLDCNDVMFAISSDLEVHRPSIVEPDLAPFGEYDDVMPWTLAFEDLGRNADFDFNDAVIQLVPDPEKEQCCVTVKAAGTSSRMYLHYDGPDGDVNMGEIHELMGRNASEYINTKTVVPETPSVQIDCVKWPKGYTMRQDARRFYIEVKRGDCADCGDVITLAEEAGQMPEALLLAGDWKWPKEGVNIMKAYPTFKQWAKDNTDMKYWNWYANPAAEMVVGQ